MANFNDAQFEAMVINIGEHILAAVMVANSTLTYQQADKIVSAVLHPLAADIMTMDETGRSGLPESTRRRSKRIARSMT